MNRKVLLTIFISLILLLPISAMAGDNTSSSSNAGAEASIDARDQSTSVSQRPFLSAFPGTGSFLFSGFPIDGGKWNVYCPPVYKKLSVNEVENMRMKFQLSNFWPWNWKSRIHKAKIGESLPGNTDDVSCTAYWPKAIAYPGDKVLSTARILGDPNWPEEAFLGMAEATCKAESGSRRVAMRTRILKDGVTVGNSVGIGGAASKVVGGGDEGVAFAAGGQLGTNRTRVEDYVEFEVLCLNDGPTEPAESWFPKKDDSKPASPAVEKPKPEEPKPCDADKIRERISELEKKVQSCKLFCFNNLGYRRALGDAYVDLFICVGDKENLRKAIEHYQIAERNYLQGHDIKSHQAEADGIIAQVYYNWAGCIRELYGREAAMKFAREKSLERIPTGFAR
ncbi:MAG: hypothetical protein AAB487_02550 [Patescibacteria group bacterium]